MRPEAAIDRVAPLDASKHFEQHRRAHLRDRPLANPWKYVLLEAHADVAQRRTPLSR